MTQTLKKIDGVYHAPLHARGKTKWISTGCNTKAEAEKVVTQSGVEGLNRAAKAGQLTRKAIGQVLTGKHLTCLTALEKFRELKTISQASKTVSNNLGVVSNWMKEAGVENLPPSAVTPQHISKWINDPKLPWKLNTRQTSLGCVRTFFAFCADQGWIVSDPSRLMELDYSALSHEQKEGTDKQPFTEAELKLLCTTLRKDWKASESGEHVLFRDPMDVLFWMVAVHVGKETGLRLSDVARLEWRSFAEAGKLVVWTGKTNRRVELPITEGLQNLVAEVPVNDPAYVFPEQRAMSMDVNKRSGLSVQFGRLCERLEIAGRSFHSLRHYKATHEFAKMDKATLAARLAEVLTLEQIAALLGHANTKTTQGYVHGQGGKKSQ